MDIAGAHGLEGLEAPRSVLRVLRFVQDYSYVLDTPDESQSPALGTSALRAQKFASNIADRQDSGSYMFRALKVKHGVFAYEIRSFAMWLRGVFKRKEEDPEPLVFAERREDDVVHLPTRRRKRKSRPASHAPDPEEDDEANEAPQARRPRRRRSGAVHPEQAREPIESPTTHTRRMVERATGGVWPAMLGPAGFAAGALIENGLFEVVRPPMPFMTPGLQGASTGTEGVFGPPGIEISARPYGSTTTSVGTHQAFVPGLLRQTPLGLGIPPSRDLLAGRTLPAAFAPRFAGPKPAALPSHERMGHVTLVAPPVKVSSPDLAKKGGAVSFDWRQMAKGATELNPSSFEDLKNILPPGAQALYPALPQGSLGPSAVNVPLAAETIGALMEQGYGRPPAGWAESIEALSWSTPPSQTLTGSVVADGMPASGLRDMGSPMSSFGSFHAQSPAHGDTPRRTGLLDFLGVPTRLAPSPGDSHTLRDQHAASSDMRSSPATTISPQFFSGFQRKALPHFQTISASPSLSLPKGPAAPVAPFSMGSIHPPVVTPQHFAPRSISIPGHQHHTSSPFSIPSASLTGAQSIGIPHPKGLHSNIEAKKAPIGHAPLTPVSPPPRPMATQATPHPVSIAHQAPPDIAMPKPPEHLIPKHLEAHKESHGALGQSTTEHGSLPSMPHAPTMPPIVAPHATITVVKPPMPLAKDQRQHPDDKHLAVQAAPSVGAAPAESAGSPKSGSSPAGSQGSKDAEVGLLANEVWSILKRRLEFESQRAGR